MSTKLLRATLLLALTGLCAMAALAAPRPLADHQLDAVYAAGFNIRVDVDVDVAATNPESLVFATGDSSALGQFVSRGLEVASSGRSRGAGSFDPNGTYMPNLQNLTMNNISLGNEAFKNSSSLLNVFALQGDVAVGLNLNVFVNPTNTNINVSQMNINFSSLMGSGAIPTVGN